MQQRALRLQQLQEAGSSGDATSWQQQQLCVMPALEAGCRSCLAATGAAVQWTLAPVVV